MKTQLLLLAAAMLPVCVAQTADPQPTGIVTIFHEQAGKYIDPFHSKDQWPERMHRKMVLDGEPLVFFHGQTFVSFRLPTGRHSIGFDSLGMSTADFELHAGERVFVRPGFQHAFLGEAHFVVSLISCQQAVQIGQGTAPLDPKYIEHAGALSDERFPADCDSDGAEHH